MTAMERSEPALAPEWLRAGSAGSSSSGSSGHSNQQLGISSLADRGISGTSRNRSVSDHNINRLTSSLDRVSSSNSRRSTSTNGSIGRERDSPVRIRPYSSFGRSYRDRDRERDYNHHKKERVLENGFHDVYENCVVGRDEKGTLLRSQSMIARRQNEPFPRKVGVDSSGAFPSVGTPTSSITKASFDREFPSLVTDERQICHEIGRVPSPGPSLVSASTFIGSSALIGGDGWTSVLADVPAASAGSAANTLASIHLSSVSTVSSVSAANTGLNMAETLAQAPLRVRAAPELSVETHRLEELAIKQSRQLIPVTPTSKTVVMNSFDKLKTKGYRSGDVPLTPKVTQQPSQPITSSSRSTARPETVKGNFQVLNRDRGCYPANSKEITNPTNTGRVVSMVGAPASGEVPSKLNNPTLKPEMKSGAHSVQTIASERRTLVPRSQDRSEFFNSLRKKVNSNHAMTGQEKVDILSQEKSDEHIANNTASDSLEACSLLQSDPGRSVMVTDEQNGSYDEWKDSTLYSIENNDDDTSNNSEEELKFMIELGWKKDEIVECLTEEEIESFRLKHMVNMPSSPLRSSVSQQ